MISQKSFGKTIADRVSICSSFENDSEDVRIFYGPLIPLLCLLQISSHTEPWLACFLPCVEKSLDAPLVLHLPDILNVNLSCPVTRHFDCHTFSSTVEYTEVENRFFDPLLAEQTSCLRQTANFIWKWLAECNIINLCRYWADVPS